MPRSREALVRSDVVVMFKIGVLDSQWINYPVRRFHAWLLDGKTDNPLQLVLNDYEIAKIRPGIHFGMFDRLRPWIRRAEKRRQHGKHYLRWQERPIDVLFIGSTNYADPLGSHRRRACEVLAGMPKVKSMIAQSRILTRADYFAVSQLAKIIVSPWGAGELCHRDFEALLDECVLVKPLSDFFQCVGSPLREDSYVTCKHDFSDLTSVIDRVLIQGGIDEELRSLVSLETSEWWAPSRIANWWLDELRAVGLVGAC